MKKESLELLDRATPEELLACIQLLAISVVQHRVKCGFVRISSSMQPLRSETDAAEDTGLFSQSKEVVEEALEMVRVLAAESAAAGAEQDGPEDNPSENRTQFRIKILLPVTVVWPGDAKRVSAVLEDISWGGASIHVGELQIEAGDAVRIMLPRPQGGSISVEAKILRSRPHPGGKGHIMAVRFSRLSTRDEAKLEDILQHLSQSGDDGGQRNSARLTQRLDLTFDGEQEMLSTLEDISAGGLGITVPDPVQIGQSLQVVISTLDESCSLKLRARVVRQEQLKIRASKTKVYRVGLKFEHPTEELKSRTNELITRMAALRKK